MKQFSEEHKLFFMKFMEWFWKSMQNTDPNFMIGFRSDISVRDYEFIYSLWNNGVGSYDDSMQERLNKLRTIYIANN
jgi:hypothetical protein